MYCVAFFFLLFACVSCQNRQNGNLYNKSDFPLLKNMKFAFWLRFFFHLLLFCLQFRVCNKHKTMFKHGFFVVGVCVREWKMPAAAISIIRSSQIKCCVAINFHLKFFFVFFDWCYLEVALNYIGFYSNEHYTDSYHAKHIHTV